MTTRPDRTAVAGVERFNGIGRTNHLPYLGVVVQEWDELIPGVAPQSNCRWVAVSPFGVEGI